MKRLYEKGLLDRQKISHSFVYSAAVSRSALQGQLLDAITRQFDDSHGQGILAAFVDFAESKGEETLRQLEQMIAARLTEEDE